MAAFAAGEVGMEAKVRWWEGERDGGVEEDKGGFGLCKETNIYIYICIYIYIYTHIYIYICIHTYVYIF